MAVAALVLLVGCSNVVASEQTEAPGSMHDESRASVLDLQPVTSPEPSHAATASTTSSSTSTSTTTSTTTTTTSTTTTTTVPDPLAGVADPTCVRVVESDETLETIASEVALRVTDLWIENDFVEHLAPGDLVDVCPDNGTDDISGSERVRHDHPDIATALLVDIERQQRRLNDLFAPYGTAPIPVDGISGPITGQHLCAARLTLGLEPSVADMQPGSEEHSLLMAAEQIESPPSNLTELDRWVLVDLTCQVLFVGSGPDLVFVFPTSTGSAGFETRPQDRAEVFRYNPAVENGGWHDSSDYPVGVDNPLNGNLYKPLYFDLGQAIHGATSVPPTPQSKGCVRLSVANQRVLLDWLGLLDVTEETWRRPEIDLRVSVQGTFVGR